jgi:hypothetical protein
MSDLEDLADAANYRRPAERAKVRRSRSRRMFFLFAGLLIAVGIAAVAYYPRQRSGPQNLLDAIRRAVADRNGNVQGTSLPRFSLTRTTNGLEGSEGWEITNEDESPLTINMIGYNGEFKAVRMDAETRRSYIFTGALPKPYPVSLRIGESQNFLQNVSYMERYSYPREVIFVDVYTDRGNFRFRGEMVTDETPAFDEGRVEAVEKEVAQIADTVDASRAAAAEKTRVEGFGH